MNLDKNIYKNILQNVLTDLDGLVIQSSDTLFPVSINSNIKSFHPIFITTLNSFEKSNSKDIGIPGVFFEKNNDPFYCDITIRRERGFISITFFNYSKKYISYQKKVQKLNNGALEL